MLISDRLSDFPENGWITLKPWHLAPAALDPKSQCYAVIGYREEGEIISEITLTTIPKDYWSDLWRVEIESYDRIGNLSRIYEILTSNNISVLGCEGSVDGSRNLHAMSFIISCSRYKSSIDKDSDFRYKNSVSRLEGLEMQFILNFLDQITINSNDAPRLKIRRMEEHYNLSIDVDRFRRKIYRKIDMISSGIVEIPSSVVREMTRRVGTNLKYTTAVDTKNRIVRILISPSNMKFLNIQITLQEKITRSSHSIFSWMSSRGANILRFQLRANRNSESEESDDVSYGRPSRLDLLVELGSAMDAEKFLEKMKDHLLSKAIIQDAGAVRVFS